MPFRDRNPGGTGRIRRKQEHAGLIDYGSLFPYEDLPGRAKELVGA